jgi:hypothetical protein
MPSILLSDNGVSSGSAGLKTTASNDGALALQTTTAGGTATNAVLVDNTQNVLVGMASYGVTNAGVSLSPTASSSFYVAGGTAVTIGRGVSDGTAVQFNRSGTNVGTIAVATTGLTVTGTNGITFTATQSASSDANTLDDYEEGTCNLSLTFGGASVGITYGTQTFAYTKIGRQVTLTGELQLTNKGSSTGTVSITGLPFTVISGNSGYGSGGVSYTNAMSFTGSLGVVSIPSTSTIGLNALNNGNIASITNASFTNTSDLLFSLTYFTT